MKYGTVNAERGIACANCNSPISQDGVLKQNFCVKCGSPLSVEAIAEYEKHNNEIKKMLLKSMQDISIKNNTDSFAKILAQLLED